MIAFIGVAATLGVFGCLVLAVVSKLRGGNAKIPLLWAAVCVALVAFMASFETDKPAEATEPPPDAPEAVEAQEPADSAEPAQNDTETPPEPVTEPEPQDNAITLVAGEKGLYGEWFTMNEEAFYIYRVPAGVYRVTNAGEYPTQASVYKGVIRNEETGFDEYSASGDVAWMDVGGSKEITVPEGWFIEIHEPTKITLVRTGDAPTPEPEPAPVEETPQPEETLSVEECVALVRESSQRSYGADNCNVHLKEGGRVLIIDIWYDGLATDAALARNGDPEALAGWNESVVATSLAVAEAAQDVLNANGHQDVTVLFNVLNDQNRNNALLVIMFGAVMVDAANGINNLN